MTEYVPPIYVAAKYRNYVVLSKLVQLGVTADYTYNLSFHGFVRTATGGRAPVQWHFGKVLPELLVAVHERTSAGGGPSDSKAKRRQATLDGRTLLNYICRDRLTQTAALLLKAKACPNRSCPLYTAARTGGPVATKALLDAKADPNARCVHGCAWLMCGASTS